MAVFTEVSEDEAGALLRALDLGELRELRGIQGGIENTNYFVTTQDAGTREYVLTLFERLTFEQLPFYLHLMKHLAQHGIPVPDPAADRNGDILHTVLRQAGRGGEQAARPAANWRPAPAHCAAVGAMLARMHLAGARLSSAASPTCAAWPGGTRPCRWCCPTSTPAQAALLRSELAFQNHVAASSA